MIYNKDYRDIIKDLSIAEKIELVQMIQDYNNLGK